MIAGLNPLVGAIFWTLAVVFFASGAAPDYADPQRTTAPSDNATRMISGGFAFWALANCVAYWSAV